MNSKTQIISIYSIGHFYVDFICAFVLALALFLESEPTSKIISLILIYNVIAFGTQPFFGFLIDTYKKPKEAAIIGLLIATFGMFFYSNILIAAIILGIGNAIYHVGGGVIALNLDPSKAKYPGIYVAPGAFGLFFGGLLGKLSLFPLITIIFITIFSLIIIYFIQKIKVKEITRFKEKKANLIAVVLLVLLISVSMRALIGYSLNLEWKSMIYLGFILTFAIFFGKFLGGIIADKYGFMNVGIAGLLIAAPLLVFFQSIPVLIFIGAFCFNLVMPITLTALAEAIPNYKGVAFGLTTLSLISGYLLFILLKEFIVVGMFFTAVVIFINVISLYYGLRKYEEMKI